MRSISWHQTLRAALPDTPIRWSAVVRATMIGVMGSAIVPGRLGEPARVVRTVAPPGGAHESAACRCVAGTVFSQTLINLLALAILLVVTFTSVPLPSGHGAEIAVALAVPLLVCLLIIVGPRLIALGQPLAARPRRARRGRGRATARARAPRPGRVRTPALRRHRDQLPAAGVGAAVARLLRGDARARTASPRRTSPPLPRSCSRSISARSCPRRRPTSASSRRPAWSCWPRTASARDQALAYGIILQAVEVVTALVLGVPALLGEGVSLAGHPQCGADAESAELDAETDAQTGA